MNQTRTLCVLLLILSLPLRGEPYKPIELHRCQTDITAALAKIHSIESDFTQTKHNALLSNDVVSKGRFYYQTPDKICMQYTTLDYKMVSNGQQLQIMSNGKQRIVSLKNGGRASAIHDIIAGCTTGNFDALGKNYVCVCFTDDTHYRIRIEPRNKTVRNYMAYIEITLLKQDARVTSLKIYESGDNFTRYDFTNQRFNQLTDATPFIIP